MDVTDLEYLPRASILHWGFSHFVVFQSYDKRGVSIVDPAVGPRRVSHEEFGREFTGVALLFEATGEFTAGGDNAPPVKAYVRRVLANSGLLLRILVVSALVQVFGLGLPVLTGMLVDRAIPRGDLGLLGLLSIGFSALVVFQFMASYIRSHLLLYLRTQLDARMTLDFLDHVFE
ncbi:peptidase domain-containing ABC transporter, partial [bacterium]